jgi:hypothetical protein
MLLSAHTSEILTIQRRMFDNSPVTPACRANDTTDIHVIRGARYPSQPSMPFRTATLDHIQCGHLDCKPEERTLGADLGLYSITYNNDTASDRLALEEYKQFRHEAERKNFRHFLEVFDPNTPGAVDPEELVHYDPHLVVGILGGSAGTTYDAFKLLAEAKKYGARVALFGRKINNAENQLAFVHFLRLIADGEIGPEEAVKAYHGVLQALNIKPHRSLADDMVLQTGVMNYAGTGTVISPPPSANGAAKKACPCDGCACPPGEKKPAAVDFAKMSPAQKVAYQKAKWDRVLG